MSREWEPGSGKLKEPKRVNLRKLNAKLTVDLKTKVNKSDRGNYESSIEWLNHIFYNFSFPFINLFLNNFSLFPITSCLDDQSFMIDETM